MKVLINGYVGKKITGIGRTFLEIMDEISKVDKKNTYIVYTNYDNAEFIEHDFNNDNIIVKTYAITKLSSIKNLLYNAFVFPFVILKEQADIIYVPNFTLILFKIRPTVSVIYDMIEFKVNNKFSKLRTMYRHFIVPRMARLSDHVITISANSKKDIIDICKINSDKISVVYCAASEKLNFTANQQRRFNYDYILFVGTVDYPGKNVYNAIKAFEKYKKENDDDLKFVICGMPGKGFETIEGAIKSSPNSNDIVYLGYVNDEDLFNIYSFAKLFIFISYYEGFGLPILEAMKFGVPVITSNKSSLPEVAGNAAIICDPDNVDEIKCAIQKIVNDKIFAQELIAKGYDNLRRFSWETASADTLEILEKVYFNSRST